MILTFSSWFCLQSKEFPDKIRRKPTDVKECKVSFFRRIAGELEKSEGLKMYKVIGSKCKVSVNVSFISAFMFDIVNFKSNAGKAC